MRLVATGLYEYSAASSSTGQADWIYFLLAADSSPAPASLSLEQSWQNETGWYIVSAQEILVGAAEDFVKTARESLKSIISGDKLAIVWLASTTALEDPPSVTVQRITSDMFAVTAASGLEAGVLGLGFSTASLGSVGIKLETQSPALPGEARFRIFAASSQDQAIGLIFKGQTQTVGYPPNGWSITLDLAGASTGSLIFPLALDAGGLYRAFGCYFQFAYGSTADERWRLPLFPSVALSRDIADFAAFDLHLHPLHPLDAALTRIQVDRAGRLCGGALQGTCKQQVDNARKLVSPFFFSDDGGVIELTPYDPLEMTASPITSGDLPGGGFAFSQENAGSPDSYYLSPAGAFLASQASASPQREMPLPLMPGLFAREFLRLIPGDKLVFLNNQPVYAPTFSSGGSPPVPLPSPPAMDAMSPGAMPLLTDEVTGSWAEVQAEGPSQVRAYFSQPSAADFFAPPDVAEAMPPPGSQTSPQDTLGIATSVDVRLSRLDVPTAFPMIPYGGLFAVDEAAQMPGPFNPDVDPNTLRTFEASILAQVRQQNLTDAPDGPVVIPARAFTPSPKLRSITTPQGLLIGVNDDGTWTDITLALGDTASGFSKNALRFAGGGSPPLVAPSLSSLLTRDQLFLVVTSPGADWNFENTVSVGGFGFDVNFTEADRPAILIFKFNNRRSLANLSRDPASWVEADRYAPNAADVSDRLEAAFLFAEKFNAPDENPFEHFEAILHDPLWTGVIAFDVPVDGNGMPPDFQMLLGGIPGTLHAHHVGVQTNKLSATEGGEAFKIQQSSVFGVVAFERPDSSPSPSLKASGPQYEVDVLIAVLSNSVLVDLNAKVSLILPSLLGRAVALTPEPSSPHVPKNAVTIQGRYQRHGVTGRVTFTTEDPFDFVFSTPQGEVRVIDRFVVQGASLVPVTGVGASPANTAGSTGGASPAETQVVADFILNGEIFFAANPFPDVKLDLFSYGTEGTDAAGLAFDGLTVRIAFELDAAGAIVPGSDTTTLLIESLKTQASSKAIRQNSLLASLPLKLSSFLTADNRGGRGGASTVGAEAQAVNVLQLLPSGSGSASSTNAPKVAPYVTTSPIFGLEYSVSLGSLGTLSDVHGGITASLILGWGPSPTIPDNDAAAVLIQLPSLSAGYRGFDLEGILKTKFSEANLVQVVLEDGSLVYALLFGNIQLSVFGYSFPPGVLVDVLLFAGQPEASGGQTNSSNIAWLLSATTDKGR